METRDQLGGKEWGSQWLPPKLKWCHFLDDELTSPYIGVLKRLLSTAIIVSGAIKKKEKSRAEAHGKRGVL